MSVRQRVRSAGAAGGGSAAGRVFQVKKDSGETLYAMKELPIDEVAAYGGGGWVRTMVAPPAAMQAPGCPMSCAAR